MSWKPEVQTGGDGWSANGLAFATREEADDWALDLSFRWTAVVNIRSVESDEPVNYKLDGGELVRLAVEAV
jgi:hypothetical protein